MRQAIELVRQWANDERGEYPTPQLVGFTEREIRKIHRMALVDPCDHDRFEKAMDLTQPAVVMPEMDDVVGDVGLMLSQPEVMNGLWARWGSPRGQRGGLPNDLLTRAALVCTAVQKTSAKIKTNIAFVQDTAGFGELFTEIEEDAAALAGRKAFPWVELDYTSHMRQVPGLSLEANLLAMRTNIALVKALRELLPGKGIGERLLIDGTDIPAWCRQVPKEDDPEKEKFIRGKTPRAGARLIVYGGEKYSPELNTMVRVNTSRKFWRGYYLIVLIDQVTGRPLVWTLWDASWDEAKALKELLYLLYELWPDAPANMVVGDAAWDEEWAYQLCEVNYGLHPIFARKPSAIKGSDKLLSVQESLHLAGFDGRGIPVCRKHGTATLLTGTQIPGREGLAPGDGTNPKGFRHRYTCPECDTRPGIPMSTNWSALAYYPHHPKGMPDRYAMRLAMLARRNACETHFSSIKNVHHLAGHGGDRIQLKDYHGVETLIGLATVLKTALMVADVRQRTGATTWLSCAA